VTKPMRWSLQPYSTGLAAICEHSRPRTHLLKRDGHILMRVECSDRGWYFYGLGVNSLSLVGGTFKTVDEAKVAAKAHAVRSVPA
jgi:hypothetical protein